MVQPYQSIAQQRMEHIIRSKVIIVCANIRQKMGKNNSFAQQYQELTYDQK